MPKRAWFTPIRIVRFWLPGLIFVVGAAMLVISPDIVGVEGAALMLGGGLGVVVSNRIHRMGLRAESDRDDELDARTFMDRYGVWPDEASDEQLELGRRAGVLRDRPAPARAAAPAPAPPTAAKAEEAPRVDPHRRRETAAPRTTGRGGHTGTPPARRSARGRRPGA